ncbi:hypothetical protein MC885_017504, partial [Smutsia gigantea]
MGILFDKQNVVSYNNWHRRRAGYGYMEAWGPPVLGRCVRAEGGAPVWDRCVHAEVGPLCGARVCVQRVGPLCGACVCAEGGAPVWDRCVRAEGGAPVWGMCVRAEDGAPVWDRCVRAEGGAPCGAGVCTGGTGTLVGFCGGLLPTSRFQRVRLALGASQALWCPNAWTSTLAHGSPWPAVGRSVVEPRHCFLQVGIEGGHAAGEEGVHRALWEEPTEVCLEEGDEPGLVRCPVKVQWWVKAQVQGWGQASD